MVNYVLVDFENVQPDNIDFLRDNDFKLIVFVGPHQNKISFDIVSGIQSLGDNARYVKVSKAGKNSLDFHLAYYLGEISAHTPDAYFHVVTKDSGFDPLLDHLSEKYGKTKYKRRESIQEIPLVKASIALSKVEKCELIVKKLLSLKSSKPRTVKTLASTINALFSSQTNCDNFKASDVESLIKRLEDQKIIVINESKVTYKLPS